MPAKTEVPRIAKLKVVAPSTLVLSWRGGGSAEVNLAGWIATGGDFLAPLKAADVFATARIGGHGGAVEWAGGDDLAIDSYHLHLLAEEQRPFGADDFTAWQRAAKLSNQEAADFLGLALSTLHAYRKGSTIPTAVQIACRAALRDPMVMQAHYRPRVTGRPATVPRSVAVRRKPGGATITARAAKAG